MTTEAIIEVRFTPGDSIEEAFSEAIRLAKALGVWVEFKFNGITCMARPGGEVLKGVESYQREIKKENGRQTAFA